MPNPRRRAPLAAAVRLGLLALGVGAAFVLVAVSVPASPASLRELGAGQGPVGAVVFVAAGAGLTLALFPYPILAAAGGLLFGTAAGTALAIVVETLGGSAALLIARHTSAAPLRAIGGRRVSWLRAIVERNGFVAVLYARIVPGVPRGVANYVFGLTTVRLTAFAVATALGTAPRAFAYAALGSTASLGRWTSPEAIAAFVALAAMGFAGLLAPLRRVR